MERRAYGIRARARWTDPSTNRRMIRTRIVPDEAAAHEYFDQLRASSTTGIDHGSSCPNTSPRSPAGGRAVSTRPRPPTTTGRRSWSPHEANRTGGRSSDRMCSLAGGRARDRDCEDSPYASDPDRLRARSAGHRGLGGDGARGATRFTQRAPGARKALPRLTTTPGVSSFQPGTVRASPDSAARPMVDRVSCLECRPGECRHGPGQLTLVARPLVASM